jgi:hypothetical protein
MSFGVSIGDGLLISQLAWRTYQGAKEACGEHDELTREVLSLHKVLQRILDDVSNPASPINRADDGRRKELEEHVASCEPVLKVMNSILVKFNALGDNKRSGRKLWQQVKFANGETKDLADIRTKLSVHTSAILMCLNLCSLGSLGRVETQLEQLPGIRESINWIAANMTAGNKDGTVWTTHAEDDKDFWRQLRRELVKEGFPSSSLHKHKRLIKAYVKELGNRGVLDQVEDDPGVEVIPEVPLIEDDSQKLETDSSSTLPYSRQDSSNGPKTSNLVTIDEVLDDDFVHGAHPNVTTTTSSLPRRYQSPSPPRPPKYHYIFNPRQGCTDIIHVKKHSHNPDPPSVVFWFRFGVEGKACKATVETDLFFDNCRRTDCTEKPLMLDYTDSENKSFVFDNLVKGEDEDYATRMWEALQIFINFLNTGEYVNNQIEASHIDAYLLSEIFASPRFAEPIMREILASLPSSKYDGNLTEILDYIYKHASSNSLLRKVYFDVAEYWFSPKSSDKFWVGGGTFTGAYRTLITALAEHARETCTCPWRNSYRKDQAKWANETENSRGSGRELEYRPHISEVQRRYNDAGKVKSTRVHNEFEKFYCRCKIAPWLDDPRRYFTPLPKVIRPRPQIIWWNSGWSIYETSKAPFTRALGDFLPGGRHYGFHANFPED